MADKATAVSFRYGNRGEHSTFRGVKGEVTVDVETPTLWVHIGDSQKPGTPLAREDLNNVSQGAITSKGIAKNDLTNISISDPNVVKSNLSSLNYANRDLSDITQTAYDTLDGIYARSNLANVTKASVMGVLGNDSYVKTDLSNITGSDLAGKGLAKSDFSNINTTDLATGAGTTGKHAGKNLAYTDLSNIDNVDFAARHIQITDNLIQLNTADVPSNSNYPSALSVKNAIDAIPPMITNMIVETEDQSHLGEITINISKPLTQHPTVKTINGTTILGVWALDPNDATNKTWLYLPEDSQGQVIPASVLAILNDSWIITLV